MKAQAGVERWFDWRIGVCTCGVIQQPNSLRSAEQLEYTPISYNRRPRTIELLFFNAGDFRRATSGCSWVETLSERTYRHPIVGCGRYRLHGDR